MTRAACTRLAWWLVAAVVLFWWALLVLAGQWLNDPTQGGPR